MTEIKKLKDSIVTIGHSLPVGMEIWFGRDEGDSRVRMNIVEPNGKNAEYAFVNSNPLPVFPLVVLLRQRQLEQALRDLLATIELHTDCMSGLIERGVLDDYVDAAEALLADGWEPDEDHPANKVTFQPATLNFPTGSLGEAVDDQAFLS